MSALACVGVVTFCYGGISLVRGQDMRMTVSISLLIGAIMLRTCADAAAGHSGSRALESMLMPSLGVANDTLLSMVAIQLYGLEALVVRYGELTAEPVANESQVAEEGLATDAHGCTQIRNKRLVGVYLCVSVALSRAFINLLV